ncbi:transcriptional regulatory protein [Janibacter sp. HTCC2649]|uniref:MarR family winged helix-turn-helix transcriptional regulator n=1 Tax=Janibacter sp. HTCC2649 TaxID=313589 RepID=UPI000066FFC7|nr:MarR family transcriptional regulator [Janibacter sp. HTCC2649]EAP96911.1 transcriptional regulatory protein [Janibacter sp. HTCC2649]
MSTSTNLRLDDQLCFALYAATNAITRAYRPLLEAVGLTYPQYLVMMVLWERDSQPIHEIASRLNLASHAVTPIVRRLESAGLVTRTRIGTDRRVVTVTLTPEGTHAESAASAAQFNVVDQTTLCGTELTEIRDDLRDLVSRMNSTSAGEAQTTQPMGGSKTQPG